MGWLGVCTLLAPTSIILRCRSEVHPGSCMCLYPFSTIAEQQLCCVHPFFSLNILLGSSSGPLMNEASVHILIHILMKPNIYFCGLYSHKWNCG